jgi:hypothetical protein
VVRLTVNQTSQAKTGDEVQVANVLGTVEANGTFPLTVVDATHIELQGTKFVNAYISGGVAIDITAPLARSIRNARSPVPRTAGSPSTIPRSARSAAGQGQALARVRQEPRPVGTDGGALAHRYHRSGLSRLHGCDDVGRSARGQSMTLPVKNKFDPSFPIVDQSGRPTQLFRDYMAKLDALVAALAPEISVCWSMPPTMRQRPPAACASGSAYRNGSVNSW